jgi:hypothetical protein
MVIWYIFSRFGMLYKEKSGNPGWVSPGSKFPVPSAGAFRSRRSADRRDGDAGGDESGRTLLGRLGLRRQCLPAAMSLNSTWGQCWDF